MKRYYIGVLVLAVITLGLAGYVISMGVSSKQDNQTEKSSQQIAEKLNSYVTKHQQIPSTLQDASIKDVPDTIRYTKKDSKSYEFCVTYKEAKSYEGAGPSDLLTGSLISSSLNKSYDASRDSSYMSSSLYLGYEHKKGENCQTITPYINDYTSSSKYNYNSLGTGSSASGSVENNSAQSSGLCGDDGTLLDGVTGVIDTTNKRIYQQGGAAGSTNFVRYDSKTKFVDSNCKPTSVADLKSGSYISFTTSLRNGYNFADTIQVE